jgi:hypothetical protein
MSASVQTTTRPFAARVPALRAEPGPAVLREPDHPDRAARREVGQLVERAVRGAVVHDDDLVRVRQRLERRLDAIDLGAQVARLVVHGKDHAHVECRDVWRQRRA